MCQPVLRHVTHQLILLLACGDCAVASAACIICCGGLVFGALAGMSQGLEGFSAMTASGLFPQGLLWLTWMCQPWPALPKVWKR